MQEKQREEEMEIDLLELAHVLLKKLWIIILCFIIGAVGMGLYTKFLVTPMYEAKVTMYILGGETVNIGELQVGAEISKDLEKIATANITLENALERAGLEEQVSLEELSNNVTAVNQDETHFLDISVQNADPETAQILANALADEVAERVVDVMSVEKPSIAERAITPKKPVSPNLIKNVILGALLGMVLACGMIIVRHLMDDTIKNEDDVRKYLGLDVLASLPDTKESKGRRR